MKDLASGGNNSTEHLKFNKEFIGMINFLLESKILEAGTMSFHLIIFHSS